MANRAKKSILLLIFLILLCGLAGGLIGELLGENIKQLFFLKKSFGVGLQKPIILDLHVFSLTFGFNLSVNLLSIIGFFCGFLIYKKV
jgi:hypothetical protein